MWLLGQLHLNRIAWCHRSAFQNYGHHARLSNEVPLRIPVQNSLLQPFLKLVDLLARISQAGDFQHRLGAQAQAGAGRKVEQSYPAGGDVLSQLAGLHLEAGPIQLIQQLLVNQVHLAEVRLARILFHSRAMLHSGACVGIALHAKTRQELNAGKVLLVESVGRTDTDGDDSHSATLRPTSQAYPRAVVWEELYILGTPGAVCRGSLVW